MRLIQYTNHRSGACLKGGAISATGSLALKPAHIQRPPDVLPGDILILVVAPDQQYLVLDLDLTGMAASPALQHVEVLTSKITGQATVRRYVTQTDAFGLPQEPTLADLVINAPAVHLGAQEVNPDPGPAGGPLLLVRHEILVASSVQVHVGDLLDYTTGGATLSLRVTGAWPLATNLWKAYCTA